jgi:hypothetical protein
MTGSRRLYVLALSCVLAVTALLFVGARAWATATARRTEARCGRPAAMVVTRPQRPAVNRAWPETTRGPATTGQGPAVAGPESVPRSWRAHTLRVAGCGAWRQVHDRMHPHRPH